MSPQPSVVQSWQLGWRLGARQFLREFRAGRLRILLLAVVLSVFAVATVSMLADRVRGALLQQAGQLLGGDLVLRSDQRPDTQIAQRASALGLRSALTAELPSTLRLHRPGSLARQFKLVQVKVIGEGFPLRGAYALVDAHAKQHSPGEGEVWIAKRLALEFNLQPGQMLRIGDAELRIGQWIEREPDAALDYSAIAPRVLMHWQDFAATGLEQPGARIGFRQVFAGTQPQIKMLERELRSQLKAGQRLETLNDARPELRVGLDRAERFLGLSLLAALTLSSTALALAAYRFVSQQSDAFAVYRTLGARKASLDMIWLTQLLLLALCASTIGLALAEGVQRGISVVLMRQLGVGLPAASVQSWWQAVAVALLSLLGFAVPLLMRLRNIPAMRVISRHFDAPVTSAWVIAAVALLSLLALAVVLAGEFRSAAIALAGLLVSLLLLAAAGWALLSLARRARRFLPARYGLALAAIVRRGRLNVLSIVAIGLSVTVLIFMSLLRTDLLAQWQDLAQLDCTEAMQQTVARCNTPNRFLINVQGDQTEAIKKAFEQNQLAPPELWPMLRGRFVRKNGQAFVARADQPRAQRMAEREFNLSVSQELPKDNRVLEGRFFAADSKLPELSVEQGLAELLGWKLGDVIEFDLGGIELKAPITSIRDVQWDNFRPNFFVLLNPAAWEDLPASWIASVRVAPKASARFDRAMAAFGNVSVIDLDFIQAQVRDIVRQVSRAVELVFFFTLICGALVLIGAISATQQERNFDASVMRVLGARRHQLRLFDGFEFAAIGIIASVIAAVAATGLCYWIAQSVFDFSYRPNFALLAIAVSLSVLFVISVGLGGTRASRRVAPMQLLKS